jgi:hypothetical protein
MEKEELITFLKENLKISIEKEMSEMNTHYEITVSLFLKEECISKNTTYLRIFS